MYHVLLLVHAVYTFYCSLRDFFAQIFSSPPRHKSPTRIPAHFGLLLIPDSSTSEDCNVDALFECVLRTVHFCQTTGIPQLTVFDPNGFLVANSNALRTTLSSQVAVRTEKEVQYPLTPPDSDYSESRPRTPDTINNPIPSCVVMPVFGALSRPKSLSKGLKLRNQGIFFPYYQTYPTLTLRLVSPSASKAHIATTASSLASRHYYNNDTELFSLTLDQLNKILEGPFGMPSPDFMLVHSLCSTTSRSSMELHGFPPWQIRLTELYFNQRPREGLSRSKSLRGDRSPLLNESDLLDAFSDYATAEMRFGK
ncbi:hypothetical protein DL96DRAFT_1702302 [Flagelloscypha sp. PMI_526]|nr:hypothetical protein DL96DRAFT_1702302 [Flagelloscypha sp. PMI_526]